MVFKVHPPPLMTVLIVIFLSRPVLSPANWIEMNLWVASPDVVRTEFNQILDRNKQNKKKIGTFNKRGAAVMNLAVKNNLC